MRTIGNTLKVQEIRGVASDLRSGGERADFGFYSKSLGPGSSPGRRLGGQSRRVRAVRGSFVRRPGMTEVGVEGFRRMRTFACKQPPTGLRSGAGGRFDCWRALAREPARPPFARHSRPPTGLRSGAGGDSTVGGRLRANRTPATLRPASGLPQAFDRAPARFDCWRALARESVRPPFACKRPPTGLRSGAGADSTVGGSLLANRPGHPSPGTAGLPQAFDRAPAADSTVGGRLRANRPGHPSPAQPASHRPSIGRRRQIRLLEGACARTGPATLRPAQRPPTGLRSGAGGRFDCWRELAREPARPPFACKQPPTALRSGAWYC